jgi:alpha-ribazole phosphatase
MVKLILVRHGRTEWNAEGRFQGQSDAPLNAVGRRQAAALSRRLSREPIAVVYASDLQRAHETAGRIAAAHGLGVRSEPRLREMSFGAWEGLTLDEIERRDPQGLAAWQADPLNVAPPGGETLAQLAARVGAALNEIVQAHRDAAALLAAHGGSLQALLCLAFGLDLRRYWQFRLDLAAVSELYVYPEGAILTLLNDTAHLRGLKWDG